MISCGLTEAETQAENLDSTYAYPPPSKCDLNENQALFKIENDIVIHLARCQGLGIVEKFGELDVILETFGESVSSHGAKRLEKVIVGNCPRR